MSSEQGDKIRKLVQLHDGWATTERQLANMHYDLARRERLIMRLLTTAFVTAAAVSLGAGAINQESNFIVASVISLLFSRTTWLQGEVAYKRNMLLAQEFDQYAQESTEIADEMAKSASNTNHQN